MKTKFGRRIAGAMAFCLVLATVLTVPFGFLLPASAAEADYTFDSGAVLITSEHNGKNILIQNGVFSVTVSGATGVTLLFDSVTMDRRYSQDKDTKSGSTVRDLYRVSTSLGLGTKAQVCPLLITDNSEVEVAFRGTNTFYAGVNGCTVTSGNVYTSSQSGGGFAGIQVDSGSALTIQQSNGSVFAYGGLYALEIPTSRILNPPTGIELPENIYTMTRMITGAIPRTIICRSRCLTARCRRKMALPPTRLALRGLPPNCMGMNL